MSVYPDGPAKGPFACNQVWKCQEQVLHQHGHQQYLSWFLALNGWALSQDKVCSILLELTGKCITVIWSIISEERTYVNKPQKNFKAGANQKWIRCAWKGTPKLRPVYLEGLVRTITSSNHQAQQLISCRGKQMWIRKSNCKGQSHEPGVLWDLLESPCPGSAWEQGALFSASQLIPFCISQQFKSF